MMRRLLVIIRDTGPLNQVLLEGSEKWYDRGEELSSVYCKEWEYCGMSKEFVRSALLCFVPGKDDYYEFPRIKAQNQLLNLWQSLALLVSDKVNANGANDVMESSIDVAPDDDDDKDLEGAVGLGAGERVGVWRRLENFQESSFTKRQKLPSTVTKVVPVAYQFVKQVSESSIHAEDTALLGTVALVETEVMSLTANLVKAREEAANSRAELDRICVADETVGEE